MTAIIKILTYWLCLDMTLTLLYYSKTIFFCINFQPIEKQNCASKIDLVFVWPDTTIKFW